MKKEDIEEYRSSFDIELLDEIAALYDAGEKVSDIIEKYKLKISVAQMSYFLPTVETDKICIYCKVPMRRKRRRGSYIYSYDIRCAQCNHYYDIRYKECDCNNCQTQKTLIKEWKKENIKSYYGRIIPEEKIGYNQLNFKNRCLLYFLFYLTQKTQSFEYLSHKAITNTTVKSVVERLNKEEVMYICPNSDIEAFNSEDFPTVYDSCMVDYIINVNFSDADKMSLLKGEGILNNTDEKEIKDFLYELMYDDLLDDFKRLLAERNINFEPSIKQLKDFRNLLNEASYTQIKYICYKVVIFYSDAITTGRLYRRKVPQQVLASVPTFYYNNLKKYGNVYKSDAEYAGTLLRVFIEEILDKEVSILDEVI